MMESQLILRKATPDDAKQIIAVYTPYVTETAISLEQVVPDITEFATRITKILQNYPYYVAQDYQGNILGYAYANVYNSRACYASTAGTSIYVGQDNAHKGIGSALYMALEKQLKKQNVVNLLSIVTAGNQPSKQFHQNQAFKQVGYFLHVGYKFDAWCDVIWMQKTLNDGRRYPGELIPFSKF